MGIGRRPRAAGQGSEEKSIRARRPIAEAKRPEKIGGQAEAMKPGEIKRQKAISLVQEDRGIGRNLDQRSALNFQKYIEVYICNSAIEYNPISDIGLKLSSFYCYYCKIL
jgi:hypothetical protein